MTGLEHLTDAQFLELAKSRGLAPTPESDAARIARLEKQVAELLRLNAPEIGPREADLHARTPQEHQEQWGDFMARRDALWRAKGHGRPIRHVVAERGIVAGFTSTGRPIYTQRILFEDGSESSMLPGTHRDASDDEVTRLKYQLQFWQAMEAEERRMWEEGFAQAKAHNDDSPATLKLFEDGKVRIAEYVANQHAIKQRLCQLSPEIAAWERRQAEGNRAEMENNARAGFAQAQAQAKLAKLVGPVPEAKPTVNLDKRPEEMTNEELCAHLGIPARVLDGVKEP